MCEIVYDFVGDLTSYSENIDRNNLFWHFKFFLRVQSTHFRKKMSLFFKAFLNLVKSVTTLSLHCNNYFLVIFHGFGLIFLLDLPSRSSPKDHLIKL